LTLSLQKSRLKGGFFVVQRSKKRFLSKNTPDFQ